MVLLSPLRTHCGLPFISIATTVVLLLCWHWWSPNLVHLVIDQDSGTKVGIPIKSSPQPKPLPEAPAVVQRAQPHPSNLVDLLSSLMFKNYGIVKSSDVYVWSGIECTYLEAQNVTGSYTSWADTYGQTSYLFQSVGGVLVHPPSGMRSSVPLGGEVCPPGCVKVVSKLLMFCL